MWVRACVCADERHWQESTRGKALFPAPGTHTDSLLYVHSVCHYAYTFGNAHSQHKIFEIPTNGRGFSLFLFSFFVIFFKCAPGLQAGWVTTSLIGSSTVDAAEKGNLQGGPDYRVQIVKHKKKKKNWHNNKGQTWHLGLSQSACRSRVRHFGYNPKQIANK